MFAVEQQGVQRKSLQQTAGVIAAASTVPAANDVAQRKSNETCPCGGGCPRCAGKASVPAGAARAESGSSASAVRGQLKMGAVNDPLEAEADRVADQVMRSTAAPGAGGVPSSRTRPQIARLALSGSPLMVQRQWADHEPSGAKTYDPSVTAPTSGSWNAGETSVGTIRRIPVEGLQGGNKDPDDQVDPKQAKNPRYLPPTREHADSRAIALVPTGIDGSKPVEVLFNLHGHNVGYRQRENQAADPSLRPGTVRDVDSDRIEQQMQASGRTMIGILPEGTSGSGFGKLDSDKYIDEVLDKLVTMKVLTSKPAVTRVLLSGHSGAGEPMAEMMAGEKGMVLPSKLGEIALFDAINGPNELRRVETWVKAQLAEDLKVLTDPAATPATQDAYLANHFMFRGYYSTTSDGFYVANYVHLTATIDGWFNKNAKALGGTSSHIYTELRKKYEVKPVGHGNHNDVLGKNNKLLDAINALPTTPTAAPQQATPANPAPANPAPVNPAPGTIQPKAEGAALSWSEGGLAMVDDVLRSPGQPLDAGAQEFFGSRFGQDFIGVRIHADEQAAESARAIHAKAYTVGSDIVFGQGQFEPGSDRGQRLLAHELSHVVQQTGPAPRAGGVVQRQPTAAPVIEETAPPVRADEGGKSLGSFNFGQFSIFVPMAVTMGSRNDVDHLKVHIFFAAGGVQSTVEDKLHPGKTKVVPNNDIFLHGLRGASDDSDWITIGVPGIGGGANKISDAEITACLNSIGIHATPEAVRLTGHSRGCDSLINTLNLKLIKFPIERVVFLDEAVEHVPLNHKNPDGTDDPDRGAVSKNRVQEAVHDGIDPAKIVSYEPTSKSRNLLTGQSAQVAGAKYIDLDPECMAAIGSARLVQDAIAMSPDIKAKADKIPKIGQQIQDLNLPPRGSFTTGPTTGSKQNIMDFCYEPATTGTGRKKKESIKAITRDPVLIRFIDANNLPKYSGVASWAPFAAHEFFVAEIAHELTE